ncbi:hypothetical protein OC834_005390 [Tilletia horrida]|nr:hypothetical protein OC834_005390 [Tilletia horrida]
MLFSAASFAAALLATAGMANAAPAVATTTSLSLLTTTSVTATVTATPKPAAPTSYGTITCETKPLYIANPVFYKVNEYNHLTYLGIQDQGAPLALTLKYGPYVQPPTPLSFFRCTSNYMPNSDRQHTIWYGKLKLANEDDYTNKNCFGLNHLRNATQDQPAFAQECKDADGPVQLKQWWRLEQADDYMGLTFVGHPANATVQDGYGSYTFTNLTLPVQYWPGQVASYAGLHWQKETDATSEYTLQLEYNSS